MTPHVVGFYRPAEGDAIHMGHHQIGDDKVHLMFFKQRDALVAITRSVDHIVPLQLPADEREHLHIILHKQQCLLLFLSVGTRYLIGDELFCCCGVHADGAALLFPWRRLLHDLTLW